MTDVTADEKNDKWVWRALLAIIVLGATLRLWGLGDQSLWYDEAASILLTEYLEKADSIFDSRYFIEAPVMALLTNLWGNVIDVILDVPRYSEIHDFFYRLLPAIAGIINIPLIYLVCNLLFQKKAPALLAAFLFAVSPFHVYYAQELRIYSILTTAGLLAILCFHVANVHNKKLAWILLPFTFSLLLYCHFISFWYILALNIVYVLGYWSRYGHLVQWTLANAFALLLSAPLLQLGLKVKAIIDQISLPWHYHATPKTGLITFKDFFFGYGPGTWAYWPLFLLTVMLFVIGLVSLRKNLPLAVLLFVLTVFPIAANIFMWMGKDFSFYEHRTFIISGVTAIITVAAGLSSLPNLRLRLLMLAALVLLTAPALANHYASRLHPLEEHRIGIWEKVDFRSAAQLIQENWKEGDFVAYTAINPMFSIRYYLDTFPQARVAVHPDEIAYTYKALGSNILTDNYQITPKLLPDALGISKRVWFIHADGISFAWLGGAEQTLGWMREHLKELKTWQLDGIQMSLFEIPSPHVGAEETEKTVRIKK